MRTLFSVLVLMTALVLTVNAQRKAHQLSLPDPHHHVVPVHEQPWETDMAPDARFVPLRKSVFGEDSVLSPNGRWRAFVFYPPDEQGGRICFQEVKTGKEYELSGIPLPYRLLSDLVWLDNDHLAFDRWSQPHYGMHYVADVRHRRLVLATPFPDEFYLHQQHPQKDTTGQHR